MFTAIFTLLRDNWAVRFASAVQLLVECFGSLAKGKGRNSSRVPSGRDGHSGDQIFHAPGAKPRHYTTELSTLSVMALMLLSSY